MVKITFKYKDKYTYGKWAEQSCLVRNTQEAIELYGLDKSDVEYKIIKEEEV